MIGTGAPATNLIGNGDFDSSGTAPNGKCVNGIGLENNNNTAYWDLYSGSQIMSFHYCNSALTLNRYVGLGLSSSSGYVTQTFNAKSFSNYSLSFDIAGQPGYLNTASKLRETRVVIKDSLNNIIYDSIFDVDLNATKPVETTYGGLNWQNRRLVFQTNANTSYSVTFYSVSTVSDIGGLAAIDNISLYDTVNTVTPTPTTTPSPTPAPTTTPSPTPTPTKTPACPSASNLGALGEPIHAVEALNGKYYIAKYNSNTITYGSVSIGVGVNPYSLRLDGTGEFLYTANFNTVSVINTLTNTFVKNISVGLNPNHLELDAANQRMYVSNVGGNSVSVIDTNTQAVIATISGLSSPRQVAIDSTNSKLYISSYSSNYITVINNSNHTTYTPDRQIDIGSNSWGVTYYSNKLFITSPSTSSANGNRPLYVYDLSTNSIISNITWGHFPTWTTLLGGNKIGVASRDFIRILDADTLSYTQINGIGQGTGTIGDIRRVGNTSNIVMGGSTGQTVYTVSLCNNSLPNLPIVRKLNFYESSNKIMSANDPSYGEGSYQWYATLNGQLTNLTNCSPTFSSSVCNVFTGTQSPTLQSSTNLSTTYNGTYYCDVTYNGQTTRVTVGNRNVVPIV
jgi:YVTN family beta-propeller protein